MFSPAKYSELNSMITCVVACFLLVHVCVCGWVGGGGGVGVAGSVVGEEGAVRALIIMVKTYHAPHLIMSSKCFSGNLQCTMTTTRYTKFTFIAFIDKIDVA